MIESGVIKLDNNESKAALVYGQMNEPPEPEPESLTGLTMAEYFRDEEVKMFYCLLIIFLGYTSRFRGIGFTWKNSICGWLSTNIIN